MTTVNPQLNQLLEKLDDLTNAIYRIACGDVNGPTGLELVSMSLSNDSVSAGVSVSKAIADGLSDIADAQREGLRAIADAITATRTR